MVNRLIQPPKDLAPITEPLAPACTDGELLMRFRRRGDQEAFAEVVERHRAMIWGVCSRVLVRRADAEDAYQATLLILAKKSGAIRANDCAGGWLFRVAHNAALGALRRRRALREKSLDETPHEPEAAFPDLEQKQLVAALLEELRAMPVKYQTALVLRYLEGHSRREIAAAMDATVATVAGHLVRGRRMLRSRLARRGVSLGLVLGALGGASASHAGTIHSAPPAFGPALLASGASGAVTALVNQGVRSMFYANITKPAIVGLASAAAVTVLFAPMPEHTAHAGEAEGTVQLSADAVQVAPIEGPPTAKLAPASADGFAAAGVNESGQQPETTIREQYAPVSGSSKYLEPEEIKYLEPEEMKSRLLEAAKNEDGKDYTQPAFKELYYQHMYWRMRKNRLQEQVRGFDRGARADRETRTKVMEDQVMAMAKVAEYERLMKQAALREVAGQEKAAGEKVSSTARGQAGYPTPRQQRSSNLANGAPLAPGDTLLFEYQSTDAKTPSFRRLTVDPAGKLDLGSGFGVVEVIGQDLSVVEATIENRFTEKRPGLEVRLGASNRESPTVSAALPGQPGSVSRYGQAKPRSGALEAGERLVVEIVERVGDIEMLNQTLAIDGDGDLALGAQWGRFEVTGKTLREAEEIIRQQAQSLAAKAWMVREQAEGREVAGEAPIEIAVQVTRETEREPAAAARRGGFRGGYGGDGFGGGDTYGGGNYGGEFGGDAKPRPNQGFAVPASNRR